VKTLDMIQVDKTLAYVKARKKAFFYLEMW